MGNTVPPRGQAPGYISVAVVHLVLGLKRVVEDSEDDAEDLDGESVAAFDQRHVAGHGCCHGDPAARLK